MLASISRARIVAGSVAGHGPMVAGSTAGAVASPAAPIAIDFKVQRDKYQHQYIILWKQLAVLF